VPEAPEIALLRRFRTELQATILQIEVLTANRNALMSVVVGLEDTLRLKGVDFAARQPREEQQSLLNPPVISSVIAVLKNGAPMGAKEIHRALHHRGIVVNYSTLYKMLNRASAQRAPVIRRRQGKYELTNNDTGTDR
jgi:hypothetical protein